jgi:hypothetical protein
MKNIFTPIITLAVFLSGQATAEAQSSFIEPYPRDTFLEGCTRLELFHSIESDIRHLAVTPIRVGKLWDHQEMGELVFSLPGVGQPIRAVAKMPRRYSEHHYVWTGDLYDGAGQALGHAVFAQKGDKKFGSIEIGGRSFIIRDLNMPREHDQLLIEIDRGADREGLWHGRVGWRCRRSRHDGRGARLHPSQRRLRCHALDTRALHARSDRRRLCPEQLAILGVADLNTALAESSIPDINVSAEVVGGVLLEEFA